MHAQHNATFFPKLNIYLSDSKYICSKKTKASASVGGGELEIGEG